MNMTKTEFRPLVAALAKGCRVEFDREQCLVWLDALCDLPAAAVELAVRRFLCEVGKWPDIATIRRFADEALHGAALPWEQAVSRVLEAVRRHGVYDAQAGLGMLDDRTRLAVKALGGWRRVCDWPADRPETLTAQFRDIYRGISERDVSRRCLPSDVRPTLSGEPSDALATWHSRKAERLPSLLSDSLSRVFPSGGRTDETTQPVFVSGTEVRSACEPSLVRAAAE